MQSENYKKLLMNQYTIRELSKSDFENTLEYYAELYRKEKTIELEKANELLQSRVKNLRQIIINNNIELTYCQYDELFNENN